MNYKTFLMILVLFVYVMIGFWQDPTMERMFPLFYFSIAIEGVILIVLFEQEEYAEMEVKA